MEYNDLYEYIVSSKTYGLKSNICSINFEGVIEETEEEVLYILYNPLSKLYKIGHTTSFRNRYLQLQTSSGNELEIIFVAYMEPGISPTAFFIESKMKKYFINKKVNGEWFKLNARDLVEIRNYLRSEEFWDFYDYKEMTIVKYKKT